MKQILWFRRDLRIRDSALLANASNEVLPIFIFDRNILDKLPSDDKRVSYIYQSVLQLKASLQSIGLDLAIFYGELIEIFRKLASDYDEVLCSIDYDSYAVSRDNEIEMILPMQRFLDSFILDPKEHLKKDGTPYKVFTPFYKALSWLHESRELELLRRNENLTKADFDYSIVPTLEQMGFTKQLLPYFLTQGLRQSLKSFESKIENYNEERDYFYKEGTSNFSVPLRFGVVSAKELFNYYKKFPNSADFIRQLFWREFYNYILYHYPTSENENFNGMQIMWNEDEKAFEKWCNGNTGVPIIDAAMRHLNETGMMHNRLRMVVSSFLTKNLFIDWKKGEKYFALKLLDYEASSNIGSWQWAASTGADAVPYFRVFNPFTQSKKFDKEGVFIKSVLQELSGIPTKELHNESGITQGLFTDYPALMVDIKHSRLEAIRRFKEASN